MPLFDLAAGLLILHLWVQPKSLIARGLSWRPLAFLGTISYGMYLYHLAVHRLVWHGLLTDLEHWHRVPKFGLRTLVFIVLTIAVSWLSYRFLELPFLRMKERMRG